MSKLILPRRFSRRSALLGACSFALSGLFTGCERNFRSNRLGYSSNNKYLFGSFHIPKKDKFIVISDEELGSTLDNFFEKPALIESLDEEVLFHSSMTYYIFSNEGKVVHFKSLKDCFTFDGRLRCGGIVDMKNKMDFAEISQMPQIEGQKFLEEQKLPFPKLILEDQDLAKKINILAQNLIGWENPWMII